MIGRMRHRLTLQAPARTGDGGGGASISWTTFATVWGQATSLSSTSDVSADPRGRLQRYQMRIRYRTDVSFATRIFYRGTAYNVVGLQSENERNKFLILTCEEAQI